MKLLETPMGGLVDCFRIWNIIEFDILTMGFIAAFQKIGKKTEPGRNNSRWTLCCADSVAGQTDAWVERMIAKLMIVIIVIVSVWAQQTMMVKLPPQPVRLPPKRSWRRHPVPCRKPRKKTLTDSPNAPSTRSRSTYRRKYSFLLVHLRFFWIQKTRVIKLSLRLLRNPL